MSKPTNRSWLPIITLGCLLATPLTAVAATDMFLKLEGIDGESKANTANKVTKSGAQKVKPACNKSGGEDRLTENCSLNFETASGKKPVQVRKAGDDPLEYIVITND